MCRDTIACTLILLCALVLLSWLGGCSDEPAGGVVGPDKVRVPETLIPDEAVDTHILDGETDSVFPEDTQEYPYYVVHHGPEAGIHAFSEGDTVPDGAHVVFKALASNDYLSPQQFTIQGKFDARGEFREGLWFDFSTTYSDVDVKPTWRAPYQNTAGDTLRFEVGPFDYDVVMRGVYRNGEDYFRDPTPDTLSFHGNFEPCIQAVELVNMLTDPLDLAPVSDCWQDESLTEHAAISVYGAMDARYDPQGDPSQAALLNPSDTIWLDPVSHRVRYTQPTFPEGWLTVPSIRYRMLLYLHGRDHVQEWPAADSPAFDLETRVKSWRYQIDHIADPGNVLREGPGNDNIDLAYGFDIFENVTNPYVSEGFITDDGVWALALDIMVPMFLMLQGEDMYWNYLLAVNGAPARPYDPADWPQWQQDAAVQRAYACWELTMLPYGEGSVSIVARDQTRCQWNPRLGSYHYFVGTRIPHPLGRICDDGFYDQPGEGIVEASSIQLDDFARESDGGRPLVKPFSVTVETFDGTSIDGGDPPGWIDRGASLAVTRASRY